MKTEIKSITPEIASQMLKKNGMNRPLSRRHVGILKNQMVQGKWLFDGTPLKLNAAGQLLDGQHRLTALVESDVTLDFVVITGLPTESFTVMDTGKVRSAADSISIESVPNATLVSDVSRSLLNFESHKRFTRASAGRSFISNSDVYNFAVNNLEKINASYTFCKKFKNTLIPMSKVTAFHMLLSRTNVEDAEVFISKFCTGLDLDQTSPIYILRQKLISDAVSKKKMSTDSKYALIVRAWNLFRKGASVQNIQIPQTVELDIL